MIIPEARTRIVCTLGPASQEVPTIIRMIEAGMDVARLNFSHGSHEVHAQMLANVREAARTTNVPLCILQDLQGPKIRIGNLAVPSIDLLPGSSLVITTEQIVGGPGRVSTTYQELPTDVHPGDAILLDDGKLRLRVVAVEGGDVRCEVMVGGPLTPRKGINLPGVAVSAPSVTEKDLDDALFGIANGVDYIALSFVRAAEDVRALRRAISPAGNGRRVPVIAKIEKPQAIANLDAIIEEADGIMVARGDLGVELPPEEVPLLQKMIIRKCNAAGKLVIVATQMLESMISHSTPTRAEASDVANAVIDGGDAVMLSGETSVGAYPLEAVGIMNRIIMSVETGEPVRRLMIEAAGTVPNEQQDALGRAACLLAEQVRAKAIVTVTHTGRTARVVSKYRPRMPIIAVTDSMPTLRALNLVWGVRGIAMENHPADSDGILRAVQERLLHEGLMRAGETFVLLAGLPLFTGGGTNLIKVEQMGM
jgi:pyruvate kinase